MNLSKSLTTILEGPVHQEVHYDPKSRKIEVVHYFNLEPGRDVNLFRIEKFIIGKDNKKLPLEESKKPQRQKGKRQAITYGTRFLYAVVNSKADYPHARKFPERGTSFPLSHLPHHIEVVVK